MQKTESESRDAPQLGQDEASFSAGADESALTGAPQTTQNAQSGSRGELQLEQVATGASGTATTAISGIYCGAGAAAGAGATVGVGATGGAGATGVAGATGGIGATGAA